MGCWCSLQAGRHAPISSICAPSRSCSETSRRTRLCIGRSPGWGAGGAGALLSAAGSVRERLWADTDRGGPLVIDIDSTLVEVHSENKAGAAPHFKRG